jgi:hypothetical protein
MQYKKLWFNSLIKDCSSYQAYCTLIRNRPELPNFSYCQRCTQGGTLYKHRLQSYRNIVYTFLVVICNKKQITMPWKETTTMEQKVELIGKCLSENYTITEL